MSLYVSLSLSTLFYFLKLKRHLKELRNDWGVGDCIEGVAENDFLKIFKNVVYIIFNADNFKEEKYIYLLAKLQASYIANHRSHTYYLIMVLSSKFLC